MVCYLAATSRVECYLAVIWLSCSFVSGGKPKSMISCVRQNDHPWTVYVKFFEPQRAFACCTGPHACLTGLCTGFLYEFCLLPSQSSAPVPLRPVATSLTCPEELTFGPYATLWLTNASLRGATGWLTTV